MRSKLQHVLWNFFVEDFVEIFFFFGNFLGNRNVTPSSPLP
jgi:hypothetical protein